MLIRNLESVPTEATNSLFNKLGNLLSLPSETDVDKIVLAQSVYEKLKPKKSAKGVSPPFELKEVSFFVVVFLAFLLL